MFLSVEKSAVLCYMVAGRIPGGALLSAGLVALYGTLSEKA